MLGLGFGVGILVLIGIALFTLLVNTCALWLATKLLKFKKQDFKTALIVVMIYFVMLLLAFSIFFISALISNLLGITLLLIAVVVSIVIFIFIIKHFYEVGWKDAILAWLVVLGIGVVIQVLMYIILIPGVVLWQLGIFAPPAHKPLGCSGFSQVRPFDCELSNNTLSLALTNAAGVKLKIPQGGVSASIDTITCSNPSFEKDNFRVGELVEVDLTCDDLSTKYKPGDHYKAEITIMYENIISGIEHRSIGTCTGYVES